MASRISKEPSREPGRCTACEANTAGFRHQCGVDLNDPSSIDVVLLSGLSMRAGRRSSSMLRLLLIITKPHWQRAGHQQWPGPTQWHERRRPPGGPLAPTGTQAAATTGQCQPWPLLSASTTTALDGAALALEVVAGVPGTRRTLSVISSNSSAGMLLRRSLWPRALSAFFGSIELGTAHSQWHTVRSATQACRL